MTSSAGLFPTQSTPSKSLLLDWLAGNRVYVNHGIEIYESRNGWGVGATRDVGFDELCMSPSIVSRLGPAWADDSTKRTQDCHSIGPNNIAEAPKGPN
jgi:hypothetical protein